MGAKCDWKAVLTLNGVGGSGKATAFPQVGESASAALSPAYKRVSFTAWRRVTMVLLALALGASCGDDGTSDPEDPMTANLYSQAGDFAYDFLVDDEYSKLIVEIDVMEGFEPSDDAVNALVDTIGMLCNKPGGVTVLFPDDVIPVASSGSNPEYTYEEVEDLEIEYRDNYVDGDTAVLYFIYVDGHSEYDDPDAGTAVLGYAYHGSSMSVFMGTITGYPFAIQTDMIKRVTIHEFGHLIGLVNNGIDMVDDHEDTTSGHERHCDNSSCMMYWENNYSGLIDVIDGEIPDFDEACLNDVAAAGGKNAVGRVQPK